MSFGRESQLRLLSVVHASVNVSPSMGPMGFGHVSAVRLDGAAGLAFRASTAIGIAASTSTQLTKRRTDIPPIDPPTRNLSECIKNFETINPWSQPAPLTRPRPALLQRIELSGQTVVFLHQSNEPRLVS